MKKADFLLIGAVLCVAGVLLLVLFVGGRKGAAVTVAIDGETVDVLPLNEDLTKEYTDADGGKNLLVIENGKARIAQADCPDKLCAKHRPVSRSGESIICLPHRLVVTVTNETASDGVDAVA